MDVIKIANYIRQSASNNYQNKFQNRLGCKPANPGKDLIHD